MIGKMIGALVGGKVAQQSRGIGGPTGALLGVAATTALRRLSLPTMAVLGVGGYFAKKYFDKQSGDNATGTGTRSGTLRADKSAPALDHTSVGTTKATGEPVSV